MLFARNTAVPPSNVHMQSVVSLTLTAMLFSFHRRFLETYLFADRMAWTPGRRQGFKLCRRPPRASGA